jgi:hypothetical protein
MLAATRVLSGISEPRSICASFTKLLPRREADRSVCHSRFTQVEPWEGQPGPWTYSFTAREIAHLLVRVAEGRPTGRRSTRSGAGRSQL